MKQVILIRQDLKMPIGKACAQTAHASLEAVLKSPKMKLDKWKSEGMKKVVLKVDNLTELRKYKKIADREKLVNAVIMDAARTFFKTPTITCLAIGPDAEEKIDKITGNLKIL